MGLTNGLDERLDILPGEAGRSARLSLSVFGDGVGFTLVGRSTETRPRDEGLDVRGACGLLSLDRTPGRDAGAAGRTGVGDCGRVTRPRDDGLEARDGGFTLPREAVPEIEPREDGVMAPPVAGLPKRPREDGVAARTGPSALPRDCMADRSR
jgi:hypothetical protein